MNIPLAFSFRLVPRGGAGLSCDDEGIALGEAWLVRATSCRGLQQCETRPLKELGEILSLAYGAQPASVTERCRRGLMRTAVQLRAGDLPRASLEAVMIGFPDLAAPAMAKLAALADLEKAGEAWQDQPRIPGGQHGGGQWTSEGSGTPSGSGGAEERSRPPQTGGDLVLVDTRQENSQNIWSNYSWSSPLFSPSSGQDGSTAQGWASLIHWWRNGKGQPYVVDPKTMRMQDALDLGGQIEQSISSNDYMFGIYRSAVDKGDAVPFNSADWHPATGLVEFHKDYSPEGTTVGRFAGKIKSGAFSVDPDTGYWTAKGEIEVSKTGLVDYNKPDLSSNFGNRALRIFREMVGPGTPFPAIFNRNVSFTIHGVVPFAPK